MNDIYDEVKNRALRPVRENDLLREKVVIRARALSTEEAIGDPERDDFPLQKGRERLMQAEFRGAFGQAFSDHFGDFEGSLGEIFDMPLKNNYRRAVFLAALNAVFRHLSLIDHTVHCRDKGPTECAARIPSYILERFGRVKVTQVGFQPCIAEAVAKTFPFRLLDLDADNIGREKFGTVVEGPEKTVEAADWADLLLVTGSTFGNDTIGRFLTSKPVLFYGTTIAAPAYLFGLERFCTSST
ncbi:MAG: DUF364 domain-containing protein [Syntrophobacteraceae bacterium]|nr:DUF364 domain-containing protein [Syntrophobacteraceae bacterium]